MAPRFDDLLNEEEGPVSFDSLVQEGGEVQEAPGVLRTFGRHFRQGVNPLWDEGAGFMGANIDAGRQFLETGSVVSPSEWLEGYRRNRDESRDTDARGAQANPIAAGTGRFTGALAQGVALGGAGGVGAGLTRAVTSGAAQGAANALASSDADLTRADAEEYARAFADTMKGGAYGAAFGAGGYGAGKALRYAGDKAKGAYRAARGTLADEARAGLDAEEAALRATDEAAAARVDKAQGQAMEANKRVDESAAREEARRVAQEARAAARAARQSGQSAPTPAVAPSSAEPFPAGPRVPGRRRFVGDPNIDPDTQVLRGYERGARKLRKDNAREVREAREQLQNPNISAAERAELESYLTWHGDAVDNPVAFRLKAIEQDLVKRGYSPDVVRRAMARFDAQGRAVSRGAATASPPALPEATRTAVPGPEDWLKRGHDMEELVRQGGGGSALDGLQEAPTRMALIRTSPDDGVNGLAMDRYGDDHLFEFRAPDGTIFEASVGYSHAFPDELIVNSIHPKGARGNNYIAMGKEFAGRMGAKNMRQLLDELKRAFPKAERILAERMSGWNPKREMDMRMPGLKPEPGVTHEFPARNGQRRLFSNEGHGPYKDWPEREPTAVDHMPRGEYELPGEPTVEMDMADVIRQGRTDIGGGGPSAFGDSFAEAPTRAGAPDLPDTVQRFDVLAARPALREGQPYAPYGAPRRSALPPEDVLAAEEAMAARRAAALGSGPSAPALEPTAGARPRALPPERSLSMRAPEDVSLRPDEMATRATSVPEVRRGAMGPEPTRILPRPEATQVGGPSDFTDTTRYAPPDMAQRLAGRPSVDSLVDERIAGGGQALRSAFWRGATGESGAMAGVAGLALGGPVGGLKGLALRGGLEVVREALRNPAAKARAIEAFKLQRLAAIRPDVWGRVSATLQRAAQRDEEAGTDYHARAARHALLQTDPAFRAAEAEAAKELQGLSEDDLARRLSQ